MAQEDLLTPLGDAVEQVGLPGLAARWRLGDLDAVEMQAAVSALVDEGFLSENYLDALWIEPGFPYAGLSGDVAMAALVHEIVAQAKAWLARNAGRLRQLRRTGI